VLSAIVLSSYVHKGLVRTPNTLHYRQAYVLKCTERQRRWQGRAVRVANRPAAFGRGGPSPGGRWLVV